MNATRHLTDLVLVALAFATGTLVALAFGTENTGTAMTFGQLAFAGALVAVLLKR